MVRLVGKGIWEADQYWPRGHGRYRRRFRDQKLAEGRDKEIAAAKALGTWRELKKRLDDAEIDGGTIAEILDLYERNYIQVFNKRGPSLNTKRQICGRFRRGPLGRRREIAASDIVTFISRRQQSGARATTINNELAFLRHFLRWAKEQNYLSEIPRISPLKGQKKVWPRPTDESFERALSGMDEELGRIAIFIRETGVRPIEAVQLKRHHVYWEDDLIVIGDSTKSHKNRVVPMTGRCREVLVAALNHEREPVFLLWGYPWTVRRLGALWKKSGAEMRLKDLRRLFAIDAAERGIPMHIIQKLLGHSSVRITEQAYAEFSPESAARAFMDITDRQKTGERRAAAAANR